MARIRDTFRKASSGWWVTDPLTLTTFSANSYRNLRGRIIHHRVANNLPQNDVDQIIHDQVCERESPEYCEQYPTSLIGARTTTDASWKELHYRALTFKGENDFMWMENFNRRVRSVGCSCQGNWHSYLREHPPRYKDYFRWSVEAHNDVNRKLGKPIMEFDEALTLWKSQFGL